MEEKTDRLISTYMHLTNDQAQRAVELCQDIVEGKADLRELNQQSLIWRGKLQTRD